MELTLLTVEWKKNTPVSLDIYSSVVNMFLTSLFNPKIAQVIEILIYRIYIGQKTVHSP